MSDPTPAPASSSRISSVERSENRPAMNLATLAGVMNCPSLAFWSGSSSWFADRRAVSIAASRASSRIGAFMLSLPAGAVAWLWLAARPFPCEVVPMGPFAGLILAYSCDRSGRFARPYFDRSSRSESGSVGRLSPVYRRLA